MNELRDEDGKVGEDEYIWKQWSLSLKVWSLDSGNNGV